MQVKSASPATNLAFYSSPACSTTIQAKEEATLAATTTLPEGNGKKRHLSFFSTISCRESASNIEAPLPLPYSLPPARYAQGKDTPWHVDNEAAGFL
mmetsp:Transcript_2617/g.8735  ORF Transcript_2617/g.8735 Transcript_2617/m.8735 type:complete len:97 (+) Transcript_2617:1635-1925(+)